MELPRRVERTVRERRLFDAGAHVLVACSGGPDSTALLCALNDVRARFRATLSVSSVDHGLRPEAEAEVAQVGRLAAQLGLTFWPLRLTLVAGKAGVQARARIERYRALHELRTRIRADVIAVGHTRDDQAETVLLRLLRGAGIYGLAGIAPRRTDGVVRPLIDATRRAAVEYLGRLGVPYVRDPSNQDASYQRVRVRSTILPMLQSENPQVVAHLAALADEAASVREQLAEQALSLLGGAVTEHGALDPHVLRSQPAALRRAALRTWVHERAGVRLAGEQLRALDHLVRHARRSAQLWLDARWQVGRDAAGLLQVQARPKP